MVLKRDNCDLNGIKIAIFAAKSQKLPSSWGLCPLCDKLEYNNGLFSTGPKLDNFCAKIIYVWFKPLSVSKTLVALLVAFTPADIFFKRLYRPQAKRANKRFRAYMYLFLKMNTKL